MPWLERAPARIFYEIEGDAENPCVTLLNGYSRSSSDFRAMSRVLVEAGYRVVRLDNRGAGQTENPAGFLVGDMVADVAALWDKLGVARSHLLGISYGGVLSILIASQHPERVRSLILVSTTPSSFFLGLDNNLSAQTPQEIAQNLARYFSPAFAEKNPTLYKSLIKETSKAFLDPASRERTAQQRAALHKFDFTALLLSIQAPVLVLHGADDQVIDPEAAGVFGRCLRNAEVEIVPDVGHLFLAEAPKAFYERVQTFLRAH